MADAMMAFSDKFLVVWQVVNFVMLVFSGRNTMTDVEQAIINQPSPPIIGDGIVNQPSPPIIGVMYERWALDCIIEVVQVIAMDFVIRPRQYREVPPNISEILQNFRFLTATDPQFPNRMQRSMTFSAILGPSDGMDICKSTETSAVSTGTATGINGTTEGSQFKMESVRLRETARAYTERQVTQGEGQLLQAFLDEGVTLQSYLRTLDDRNNVVIIGNAQTKAIFDGAAQVLRDKAVAAVFGRPPAPQASWPLGGVLDDNGARLIEEVAKAQPATLKPITQNKFDVMQRVASYGAMTITGVLGGNFSAQPGERLDARKERVEPLIGAAYSWKTALDALALL